MKSVIGIFLITLVAGCGAGNTKLSSSQTENAPLELVAQTFYSDKFLVEVGLPKSWHGLSLEQMERLNKTGEDLLVGDDEVKRRMLESASDNTQDLFSMHEYELGAPVKYNPSIACTVENVDLSPGLKRGMDYLFHVKTFLESSSLSITFDDDMYSQDINGVIFDYFVAETNMGFAKIQQRFYSTIIDGRALGFVLSYGTDHQLEKLTEILGTVNVLRPEDASI